jgi:hypothetical protein
VWGRPNRPPPKWGAAVNEPLPNPVAVPSLDQLHADPRVLEQTPLGVLLDLQRQLGHLGVEVAAAITRQIAHAGGPRRPEAEPAEDWISLDEAAAICRRSRAWLLRLHPRPAWLKALGRKSFVVNRRTFQRWLDSRPS